MKAYTFKLRHRGSKYRFDYNSNEFTNLSRACTAARDAARARSDKYDRAVVVETNSVKSYDIKRLPERKKSHPKAHRKTPNPE